MKSIWLGIIGIMLLLVGCSRSVDGRLVCVNRLCDSNDADSAIAVLKVVCRDSLSEHSRYYYDLMSIKARDKAYQDITGDTIITDIISYFERNGSEAELGEAYYYGGRVRREQGDAPQALDYFQKSLDALTSQEHLHRKGKIASQMGQLFLELYMFEQAKPKFQEAIKYGELSKDTFGIIMDYRELGEVYSSLCKSDSALNCFTRALNIVQEYECGGKREVDIRSSILDLYVSQGEYKKAKQEFVAFDSLSHTINRDYVLSTKINVHIINKEYSKAIELAHRLKKSQSLTSKIFAYSILLDYSKEIGNNDSIYFYAIEHKKYVDILNSQMSKESVIHQNSFYNYTLREKENYNLKEQKSRIQLNSLVIILLLIILIAIIVCAYRIIRRKNNYLNREKEKLGIENETLKSEKAELLSMQEKMRIELLQQLDKITLLEKNNESLKMNISESEISAEISKRIKERIDIIDSETYKVDYKITNSNAYLILRNELGQGKGVSNENVWNELDELINEVYPNFRTQLIYLYNRLNNLEYRVCLLIKCKFSPKEIAILVFRDKSTISNIRVRLNFKFFGIKSTPSDFDKFILSL